MPRRKRKASPSDAAADAASATGDRPTTTVAVRKSRRLMNAAAERQQELDQLAEAEIVKKTTAVLSTVVAIADATVRGFVGQLPVATTNSMMMATAVAATSGAAATHTQAQPVFLTPKIDTMATLLDHAAILQLPIGTMRCLQWVYHQHLQGGPAVYTRLGDMELSDMGDVSDTNGCGINGSLDHSEDMNDTILLDVESTAATNATSVPQEPTPPPVLPPVAVTAVVHATTEPTPAAGAITTPTTATITNNKAVVAKAGTKSAAVKLKVSLACEWQRCTHLADHYSGLRDHLNAVHGLAASAPVPPPSTADDEFQCAWDLCSFSAYNWLELRCHAYQHVLHSHLKATGEELLARKQLTHTCALDSRRRNTLPDGSVRTRYACEWSGCSEHFEQLFELCAHVRLHVAFERSLRRQDGTKESTQMRCGWAHCSKRMDTPGRLVDHLRLHLGERQMACPNCGSTFTSYSKFYAHFYRQAEESA